ncbi:glutamate/tyrosine decarboxylase-like PLP-dependent enzyme [Duganella sp. 1224]|uniref:pyridoxal phosphate-dependent decarboxylase family protein n=1 Tax=Duganella sp. 1224 TaxID=2587052 RepID=UPI0018237947|nr:aspartate aminotransferase family protein [Duganella sp. 1224]NYE60206.1 glutamate/tyrosine decarboxylase-like PLP-dependent enzyme [Duganella sp. 1224]
MAKKTQENFAGPLDPADWQAFRAQGHRMLDDMIDYLQNLRQRPVWQPVPQEARAAFHAPLPARGSELAEVHQQFMEHILPYTIGNIHPGFFGWVQGGGTPVGMLAEMLAAGLNANCGGRDQIPVEVERQITRWMAELFGFPASSSGLFVTGSSLANMIAVLVARYRALGREVRSHGIPPKRQLVAYASAGAHGCIAQAMDLAGLGSAHLRRIPMNAAFQMDIAALESAIAADRQAGLQPFFVAGTAGTVDVGAIDALPQLAAIAERNGLWFHVDGAYGALAALSPELRPLLAGIELADSIACDFHKWGQVPYDAGFILVRDAGLHLETFASRDTYLRRDARGMAANSPWPCDFGPDLSRGFRALKTWFTFQVFGAERIGQVIYETCLLARYLEERVKAQPELELLAPVALNIVCFRHRAPGHADADAFNAALIADLQESGIAAPSATTVRGHLTIRTAIVNHRTGQQDIDALLNAVLTLGAARLAASHLESA